MRALHIPGVYSSSSMGHSFCLIPALSIGVRHLFNSVLKLRKLSLDSSNLIFTGLTVGRDHGSALIVMLALVDSAFFSERYRDMIITMKGV